MQFTYEPKHHAKAAVAIGLVALALIIEGVSFAANYSILHRSFADWPPEAQRILAIGAAIVIEGAVIVLLLGMLYSFESLTESCIAGGTLALLIAVMAVNFLTHGSMSEGQTLNTFQQHWVSWVGKLALFAVFACVISLGVFNPDAVARRKERELQGKIKDARNQAYNQVFASDRFKEEIGRRMDGFASEISAQVLPTKFPPPRPQTPVAIVAEPRSADGERGNSKAPPRPNA